MVLGFYEQAHIAKNIFTYKLHFKYADAGTAAPRTHQWEPWSIQRYF